VWFMLYAHLQQPFGHLWVVQHDVGFSGNLFRNLALAADATSDLVCVDHSATKGTAWAHINSRNKRHSSAYGSPLSSCLLPLVRYSRRLLWELVNDLHRDRMVYCEARAATACAARGWCHTHDLRDSARVLGIFTFYSLLNESTIKDESRRCPGDRGRFFHRVV